MENAPVGYYARLLCEMRSLADGKKSFAMQEALTRTEKVAHSTITSTMRSEAVNLKKRGTILHSMTSISSS